jgi:2-(1,2-epoxy-1,2-dihydrophenyl)acetyl-CoA isomerase
MSEPLVRLERNGSVATVILSRPDKGNAIDIATAQALGDVVTECAGDRSIRCVLMTGAGNFFCGGGDIQSFFDAGDDAPRMIEELVRSLNATVLTLANMDKPLVTAVNGPAAGAGFSLAILGDIVLASPAANLTVAYTAIGLTPDLGISWLLPRLVGMRRALELSLTNRRVDAAEAERIGLVTRIVDADALMSDAQGIASFLSRSATGALARTRRLLFAAGAATLEQQMDAEAIAIGQSMATADAREGIAAFLAKRKADFPGL